MDLCGKVMSLLLNALSRFVIAFLQEVSFDFMAPVTVYSDFGAQKNKVCHCFQCFPICLPWSDGTDAMILVFWMLSFKPTFSLSSFTFIKRLFSSSSLSAIRAVSSAYLRLLIFFPAILLLAPDIYQAPRSMGFSRQEYWSGVPLPSVDELVAL